MNAFMDHQRSFNEIIKLLDLGDTSAAESLCRAALLNRPADVTMNGLLGAVLLKMNRLDEAEQRLRETIALAPAFARPHEDLGLLLLQRGHVEEAVSCLQTATGLDPGLDAAWFNLGKALALAGRGRDADAAFERAFELSPERKALAFAARHESEGRLDEAEDLCRDVLRRNPASADALRLLGMLFYRRGHLDAAERQLCKAVEVAPDFTGALIDLGRMLKEQDRHEEAIDCFRRAIAIEPDNPKTRFLLAGTLAPIALTHEALQEYRCALALRPRHAGAMLGLGHMLKTVGRQDEAVSAYHECIRFKPDNGETYWSLANLKTYRFGDAEIADMTRRADDPEQNEQSAVNFLFALAKAHEDRKDFARAWDYYRRGNERQRRQVKYDPVQTEVLNNSIIETFSTTLFAGLSGGGCPDPAPIFILGLPRSGSTLIEQVLASHSLVEGTSELPYIGRIASALNRNRADGIHYPEAVRRLRPADLVALGEEYLQRCALHRVAGASRFIDKMPNNFPNVGFIHLILPNARIIDARRHPLDACLGCYRQLFARGQTFTYDLVDIGEYYLQYQRMMDHWQEVLPGRVLTVQYERLVTDFDSEAARILDYCGLPWEDGCRQFFATDRPVRTASSEQVRQPIYTSSVGFWRNYEPYLRELREVLAPLLPRYADSAAASQ